MTASKYSFMFAVVCILSCIGITTNCTTVPNNNPTYTTDTISTKFKSIDTILSGISISKKTPVTDTTSLESVDFSKLDTKLKYHGDETISQNSLKKITPDGWEIITYDKGPITNFSDSCLVVIFKTNVADTDDDDCFKRCLSIFQIINGEYFLKKQSFNSLECHCSNGMAGTENDSDTPIGLFVNGYIYIDYDVLYPYQTAFGYEDGEWWLVYEEHLYYSCSETRILLYDAEKKVYQTTFHSNPEDCGEEGKETKHWSNYPFRKVHMGETLDFSNHPTTETVDCRFSVCSLFTMEGYLHFIRERWLKDATKILTEKGTINNYGWSESSLFDTDFHILERNSETGELSRIGTNLIQIELQPSRYWESDKCKINYDINTLSDDLSEDGKRFLSQDWVSMSDYEKDANERRFKYSLPYRCYVFGKLFGKYSFCLTADYTNPDKVTGFYFYDNKGIPIHLEGTLVDGKLMMTETVGNQITGYWELNKISYRDSYWYNADKSKKCEIEVEYIERTNDN